MMQHYDLISAEQYDNLPDDPGMKFVELESICRRSVSELTDHISDNDYNNNFQNIIRLQYMTTVAAAAEELGFSGLDFPHQAERPEYEFGSFMMKASGIVTRIRLRTPSAGKAFSVRLSARTRGRIELQINKLREIVENADLPENKRKALLQKLDELSAEVLESRVSFAKTMELLAFIGMSVATTTSFLADAPAALTTITSLIGQDKAAEEEEVARLGAPPTPKRLPPPQPAATVPASRGWDDLDDDVPF